MDYKLKKTGNGLIVFNMLHVYQTILNQTIFNSGNYTGALMGYLEACVHNFTSLRQDLKKSSDLVDLSPLFQITYIKKWYGTKKIIENKKDLLMRYAKQYFIDNEIDFEILIINK